jgi:hypothetical protein
MQREHIIIAVLALITFILSMVLVMHKKERFAYENLCRLQKQMILDAPFIGTQPNAEEAYQNCMNWPGYMPSASVYQKY